MTGTLGEMRSSSNEFPLGNKFHIFRQEHSGALDIFSSLHVAYQSSWLILINYSTQLSEITHSL